MIHMTIRAPRGPFTRVESRDGNHNQSLRQAGKPIRRDNQLHAKGQVMAEVHSCRGERHEGQSGYCAVKLPQNVEAGSQSVMLTARRRQEHYELRSSMI